MDISIKALRLYEIDTRNPDLEKAIQRQERDEIAKKDLINERNRELPKRIDRQPELRDFYNEYDALDVTDKDRREYLEILEGLEEDEKKLLGVRKRFYVVDLENHGGLVMPVILQVHFKNGETKRLRLPAEIWRKSAKHVSRLILTDHEVTKIELDPQLELADVNRDNNYWPPRAIKTRFQLHKEAEQENPMQTARDEERRHHKESEQGARTDNAAQK